MTDHSLTSESTEPRRWTIRVNPHRGDLLVGPAIGDPTLGHMEDVEVMPVSEHEEAMYGPDGIRTGQVGHLNEMVRIHAERATRAEAEHERLREAAQAVSDAEDAGRLVPVPDEEVCPEMDALRATLEGGTSKSLESLGDRLEVTDEMVERAVAAYRRSWPSGSSAGTMSEAMGCALEAALGGER